MLHELAALYDSTYAAKDDSGEYRVLMALVGASADGPV